MRLALLALLAAVVGTTPAPAPAPRSARSRARLLVVYVAGRDAVSTRRVAGVHETWKGMQVDYSRWSLRCLFVFGGLGAREAGPRGFAYRSDPVCPSLSLSAPDEYTQLGHEARSGSPSRRATNR